MIGIAANWRHNAAMAIIFTFLLGIGNFAMHRAVLESGHPLMQGSSLFGQSRIRWLTLTLEFVLLLAAMLLIESGRTGWGVIYWLYTGCNGIAAWLILTRRI